MGPRRATTQSSSSAGPPLDVVAAGIAQLAATAAEAAAAATAAAAAASAAAAGLRSARSFSKPERRRPPDSSWAWLVVRVHLMRDAQRRWSALGHRLKKLHKDLRARLTILDGLDDDRDDCEAMD